MAAVRVRGGYIVGADERRTACACDAVGTPCTSLFAWMMMPDAPTKQPAIIPCTSCGKLNRIDLARTDAQAKCGACRTVLSVDTPLALTDAIFDQVMSATAVPVIVDFYADWCGPCKMMAPVFAELARRQRGQALVVKVDTERNPALSTRFSVRSIPTLVVMRDGKEVARQVGAASMPALEELLRRS